MVRLGGVSAGVLAVSTALAGCSAEAGPQPLPPVPSVSPTPAVLPMPPEAMAETPQGASAFTRYYMAVLERALATGNAAQLRALSDPGCGGCRNLIGAVDAVMTAGRRVRAGEFNIVAAVAPALGEDGVIVDLRYEREAGELVDDRGAVATAFPAEPAVDAQVRLIRSNGTWIVLGFRAVPAG